MMAVAEAWLKMAEELAKEAMKPNGKPLGKEHGTIG
jgi:hypothetical protein